MSQVLEFYGCNEWLFHTENIIKLNKTMSEVDRRQFDCDVRLIDWPSYVKASVLGVRQFILKENPNTLPAAQRKLTKYLFIIYFSLSTKMIKYSNLGIYGSVSSSNCLCYYYSSL